MDVRGKRGNLQEFFTLTTRVIQLLQGFLVMYENTARVHSRKLFNQLATFVTIHFIKTILYIKIENFRTEKFRQKKFGLGRFFGNFGQKKLSDKYDIKKQAQYKRDVKTDCEFYHKYLQGHLIVIFVGLNKLKGTVIRELFSRNASRNQTLDENIQET